jgi:hypothetical protein
MTTSVDQTRHRDPRWKSVTASIPHIDEPKTARSRRTLALGTLRDRYRRWMTAVTTDYFAFATRFAEPKRRGAPTAP